MPPKTQPKPKPVAKEVPKSPPVAKEVPKLPEKPLVLPDITKAILNNNTICSSYNTAFSCNKNITCFWGSEAVPLTADSDPSICNSKCRDNEYWSSDGTCTQFTI